MNGHTDNRKIIDLAIESVKVEGRFRKDLGDLKPLAESMARVGQLHPIVVRSDLSLIAGLRRLEAAKLNRWATIRAMVDPFFDDALQALIAQRDENDPEIRKEMTVSEKVALGRAIEPLEREKAAERQKAGKGSDGSGGRGNKKPCGESPQGFSAGHKKPPRTRDKVAEALGMGGQRYSRAKAVVEAAEQDPETFGPVKEEMDRTGNVAAAYHQVKGAEPARQESGKPSDPPSDNGKAAPMAHPKLTPLESRVLEAARRAGAGGRAFGPGDVRVPGQPRYYLEWVLGRLAQFGLLRREPRANPPAFRLTHAELAAAQRRRP